MTLVTPAPVAIMDGAMHLILTMIGSGTKPHVHAPGIIQIGHFSAEHEWCVGKSWDLEEEGGPFSWGPDDDHIPVSCVADSIEQWRSKYGEAIEALETPIAVFFTHIPKNPGERYGWRWHKWGTYVGEGDPRCEYLADEEGFDEGVFVVHLHRVLRAAGG